MAPVRVPAVRLLVAVALLSAAPARAQEPDTVPSPDVAPAADTVEPAQPPRPPYTPPRFALSIGVGTLGFGDLQRQGVTAELLDGTGAVSATDTLTRTLGAGSGLQLGASALLGLTPAWALRGGVSWGRATFRASYAGDDALKEDAAAMPTGADDELTVLAAEGALRFRFLSLKRLQPYAELGVGAIRIEASEPAFPGAAALTGETRLAGLAAIGAVIPLWEAVTARIQATGHFFRTPASPAAPGVLIGAVDSLRLTFQEPGAGPFADVAVELTRVLRLEAGLSLELGAAARRRAAAAGRQSDARP